MKETAINQETMSNTDNRITIPSDEILEEAIHKADEVALSDVHEPKVRFTFPIFRVIGFEIIWVIIGGFFAAGLGTIPIIFFFTLGNSFNDLAVATPDAVHIVAANMGLNITYIAIGAGIAGFFSYFFFGYSSQRIANRLRERFFERVLNQEIGFFDIKKSGSLASAISDDCTKAADLFAMQAQVVIQNAVQVTFGVILALVSNWTMALLLLCGIPVLFLVQFIQRPILAKIAGRISKLNAGAFNIANEVITSMRTVRSMAGEDKEVTRFSKELDRIKILGFFNALIRGIGIMIFFFSLFGGVALAFWYAGKMLQWGTITIGDTMKVTGMGILSTQALIFALVVIPDIIKAQVSIKELLKVILREPTMKLRGGKTLPDINGHLSFKNVTFRYPSRPKVAVLKDFSLEIQPGTSVALVGQSGSGKSTIIGLLEQWYTPEIGTVELDGVDITTIDSLWLHRYLGIVSQEPTLFATTIRRNISYAVDTINGHISTAAKNQNPKIAQEELLRLLLPVTQELIEKAAIAANAHDFIIRLPDGYDTIIGERGVSLSGGQKQRVAIARAVLQDPKILLLDEATSALDTKSEALVQDALDKLMVGRTSVVIAHRLTTVQDCNNIVVMRQGAVVEMGTHDEMIRNTSGAYYSLAAKQLKFGKSESSDSLATSDSDENTSESESISAPEEEPTVSPIATTVELLPEPIEKKPIHEKKKRFGRKKNAETFTNEAEIKDVHEPITRNPFKVFKLCGFDLPILLVGLTGAFLAGTTPIFNYMFFGNTITLSIPQRNDDGSFIPFPPGYSVSELVATQASYVAIVAGTGAVANFFNWFFTTLAYERITVRVKKTYFASLVKQEMGFFDIKKSGKLLSTLGEDISSMVDGYTMKAALFTQHIGQFVIGIVMALIASWQTALVMLAAGVPTIGSLLFFCGFAISILNKKIMHLSASALTTSSEVIGAIRTVRSMAGEEREQQRFKNDLIKLQRVGFYKAVASAIMLGGMQFFTWAVAGLAFWYGGTLVASGTLAPGKLFQVFGNMLFSVLGAALALSEVQNFFKAAAASKIIQLVTEREPAIPNKGGIALEKIEGHVEFKDITFEYPSRPGVTIMKDFNLTISKGQHVALVGESGSGKSTITGLLERFYEPLQGIVLLDGVDLKTIDVKWLHRNIAIVTQEPTLFATTIRKNITYAVGDENVTLDQVIECAKAANCHDFITQLPNGYDTMIGERGVSMSGGQKQRITIARAMIQNASLLLLDEATSALDTEAETLVQAALDKLMVGRTTIVIAHRLTTVKDCDLIVTMKSGSVVEMGTHEQLIQKKGIYAKLAQKQLEFGQMDKGNRTSVTMTEDD